MYCPTTLSGHGLGEVSSLAKEVGTRVTQGRVGSGTGPGQSHPSPDFGLTSPLPKESLCCAAPQDGPKSGPGPCNPPLKLFPFSLQWEHIDLKGFI